MKTLFFSLIFLALFSCSKSQNNLLDEQLVVDSSNNELSTSNNQEDTESESSSNTDQSDPLLNDIDKMKSLFESFNGVKTTNDSEFFYVSSDGLPSHNMMEET